MDGARAEPSAGQNPGHESVSGATLGPPETALKDLQEYWLKCIEEWYPNRLKQTYFLPPVFFRRVSYSAENVSGQQALVSQPYGNRRDSITNQRQAPQGRPRANQQNQKKKPPPPAPPRTAGAIFTLPNPDSLPPLQYLESNRVDDDATERFLKCLRYLSKQGEEEEVMMVISQLLFQKYLKNNTSPIELANVRWNRLPRPRVHQHGDFDVLIIHRHYGLIVCELKGVGGDRGKVADSDDLNRLVARRVNWAVDQLKKAKDVLTHLVSDIADVQVTKTLVLPNVTSAELISAVNSRRHLEEKLCACLEARDLSSAISRCLCSDRMPSPADLHYLAQGSNSTNQASQSTSGNSTNQASQSTSGNSTNKASQSTSGNSTNQASQSTSGNSTNQASQSTSGNSINRASQSTSDNSTNQASQSTSGNSNWCHWLTSLNCCHWLTGLSDLNSSTLTSTLDSWWKEIKPDQDPHMSDDVYSCLLARFCGPATIVEVPTVSAIRTRVGKKGKLSQPLKVLRRKGEAVAETGLIFSLLTLYPDHVTILSNNTLRCVHLYGPPGTGKTIVLVLKALQWLRQGRLVYVVSFYEESRAVSILIESYLQLLLCHNKAPAGNQVPVSAGNQDPVSAGNHMITLEVIKQPYAVNAINTLTEKAVGQELCVIADEVAGHSNTGTTGTKDFERFIKDLRERIPTVSVWCASMQKLSPRLTGQQGWMSEEKLTIPLRSPPLVTKEVAMSTKMRLGNIPAYSICPVPAATEGPPPLFLDHPVSQGHKAGSAFTCDLCGQAVVGILKDLNVRGEQENGTNSLHYRDVILLVTNNIMKGTDDTEPSTKGIVPALRDSGFPVKVLKQGCYNDEDLRDVALALTDQITVTNYEVASGLERMVVIGMGTQAKCKEMYNRLFGMSRCTSQLIWIGKVTEG